MKYKKLMGFIMAFIIVGSNISVFANSNMINESNNNEYLESVSEEYSVEEDFNDVDNEGSHVEGLDIAPEEFNDLDIVTPEDNLDEVEEFENEKDIIPEKVEVLPHQVTRPSNNYENEHKVLEKNDIRNPIINVDNSNNGLEAYLKALAEEQKEELKQITNQGNDENDLWESEWDNDWESSFNGGYGDYSNFNNKEKKITPNKTMQFTTNLKEKYPSYFDTGFYVNDENLAEYLDIQDALKILAFQTKSKFIEDSKKSMVIVEGVPVVIEDNNELINFTKIENSFKGDNIIMTSSPTRIEGLYNMTEVLEKLGKINIMIDDVEMELELSPIIKDSNVLFTIRPIGKSIGADVEWNKEKGIALIEKDNKNITYTAKQKYAKVNEKEYELPTAPFIDYEENRLFSTINLLIDEMGGYSEFDTRTKTLHIYTK